MVFFKKNIALGILALLLSNFTAYAQEPNFSMYHYAPFFTNPGMIGTQENVSLMLNYRNQSIAAGESFRTSSLSGYYPVYLGNHRLVIAANLLNDQVSEFVTTNGGLLGVAYSIRTTSKSELSFGLQSGFFQRKINNDFTTDDQFVNGVFDPGSISGDAVFNQTKNYPTLSAGLHYKLNDAEGREKAFIGGAIFNAIEPNVSFIDAEDDKLPLSFRATAGYRVYQGLKFSVLPTVRVVNQASNNFLNIGSRFGYELAPSEKGVKKIDLGVWYNTNDMGVFSIAYEQPDFTIGVSYDLPVGADLSTAQNGIFELAISLRIKKKSKKYVQKQTPIAYTEPSPVQDSAETEIIVEEQQQEIIEPVTEPVQKEIEQPQVVVESEEEAKETEEVIEEYLTSNERDILSKTVRFQLNSDELTEDSQLFLNTVSDILNGKTDFQIELIGHTCSLGSEKLNADLSIKRANEVLKYLTSKGVEQDRFIVLGAGESDPLHSKETEEARMENRRVEFNVLQHR